MTQGEDDRNVLGRKFAIGLLLEIARNEGQTQIALCGASKSKAIRLRELEDEGLIRRVRVREHNIVRAYLTDKGRRIAPYLRYVMEVMQ